MTVHATQPAVGFDRKNKSVTLADGSVVLLTPYLFEAFELLWKAKGTPVAFEKFHTHHTTICRLRRLGVGIAMRRGMGYALQRAAA